MASLAAAQQQDSCPRAPGTPPPCHKPMRKVRRTCCSTLESVEHIIPTANGGSTKNGDAVRGMPPTCTTDSVHITSSNEISSIVMSATVAVSRCTLFCRSNITGTIATVGRGDVLSSSAAIVSLRSTRATPKREADEGVPSKARAASDWWS